MMLKRRLQQIEVASNVRDGHQPVTAICRIIVDLQQQPCKWLFKGVGATPDVRAQYQAEAVSQLIAQSGKLESAFTVAQQPPWTSVTLAAR
jgi:hypothetical protein